MKRFYRILSLLVLIVMLTSIFTSCNPANTSNEGSHSSDTTSEGEGFKVQSHLSGTFIQPWLYGSWSDKRWDDEAAIWDQLGIELVIMGDTAAYNLDTGVLTTSYPTKIEGASCSGDITTMLFEKCRKYGKKLYIGIGNTPAGWPYLDFNKAENFQLFKDVCQIYAAIAEDIYNEYYEKYPDVFAGFYFVPEMYNSSMFDNDTTRTTYVEGMAGGLNIVFEKITQLNPALPFIFSPYVNIFGGSWVSKSSENIGKFWTEFLSTVNFRDGDILCPQDSVGAGGMDLEHLEEYTAMYKKATEDCGKKIRFWSNCETFVQPSGEFFSTSDDVSYWGSCSVGRMIQQFETVGKYAERTVTFAWPHYQSPYNNVKGYYETYIDYLKTGTLDAELPTGPDTFRTTKGVVTINGVSTNVLRVTWSGMYDNLGIWKVNIYKDGTLLTYRYTTRTETGLAVYPNSFYDADYDFDNETATYEIEVIDCAGNVGNRVTFTVEAGSVPNNVKLGKGYTDATK